MGSANCTFAALGREGFAGQNEEVCLYRRLPRDSMLAALELADVLTNDRIIDAGKLDDPVLEEDLALDRLAEQSPGKFECRVDVLSWRPAPGVNHDKATIELLDQRGRPLSCTLSPLGSDGEKRRYQISGTEERPSFARLSFPGGHRSAPAIVTLLDRLNAVIRETRSRKAENALRDLDSETEASLMLLEVIEVLEKLEPEKESANESISIPKADKGNENENDTAHYKVLSYEQFVAGRRPRTEQSQLAHNSLAGSEVTLVRGFLNRILGMAGESIDDEKDEDPALGDAFNLGDETANPEEAIASGQEFADRPRTPDEDEAAKAAQQRKTAQRNATKEQIVTAASSLGKRIKECQAAGALDSHDVLRLRALLMIIAAASWPGKENDKRDKRPRSSLQVLPVEDDPNSWPFVMGRLLFSIFGGRDPAIRQLYLSGEHDQIPGDIVECWATCYWCFQACLNVPVSQKEHERIIQHLHPLAELAYRLTLPTDAELLGLDVTTVMDGMSARYAGKLEIDSTEISNGHRSLVDQLFSENS
tara:strand:- start:3440 stop:5044 length:1605 start_codon:yes stop_codon:yes gene_type:complete